MTHFRETLYRLTFGNSGKLPVFLMFCKYLYIYVFPFVIPVVGGGGVSGRWWGRGVPISVLVIFFRVVSLSDVTLVI